MKKKQKIEIVIKELTNLRKITSVLRELHEEPGVDLNDIQPEMFCKILPMSIDEWDAEIPVAIRGWQKILESIELEEEED